MKDKKQKLLFLVGLVSLLIFLGGTTFAYFSIITNDLNTTSGITGSLTSTGIVTLSMDTTNLSLTLGKEMSSEYIGSTYYATSSGTPQTTDPKYKLATATLTGGDIPLDCTYNFKLTAKVVSEITDGSDSNVLITIGNETKTLKEVLDSENGVIITGKINNLTTSKTIDINSYVNNSNSNQNNLQGNTYTITLEPYSSGDTSSFSCKIHKETWTDTLITTANLWNSNLEDDGYRYIGVGPDNFICFGTTDKDTCTANPGTYMYRIIGVFQDESGENHIKLIKYTQLASAYAWNSSQSDADWANSTLYAGLNGSYFLTNTIYSYMQDNTWLGKIENWKWSAVNTQTYESGGSSYNGITTKNIYLHEMNRSSKTTVIGEWITPKSKIGLMYASDYAMSLGADSLSLKSSTAYSTQITSWMHQSNNDTSISTWEWIISRYGSRGTGFVSWDIEADGSVNNRPVTNLGGVRPAFYLASNIKATSGEGILTNPYILS